MGLQPPWSVKVGPDGIFDEGSRIGTGVGLIPWSETFGVSPESREMHGIETNRFLGIKVLDVSAVRKRVPSWKRRLSPIETKDPHAILVPSWLLSVPVDDLVKQIDQYVETHAPAGWMIEEDDETAGEAQSAG
jgi:hypothetical protein